MKGDARIDSDHQYLKYLRFDEQEGSIFELQKKTYMTYFNVSFDLRYFKAYQGFEGTRSGATILRVAENGTWHRFSKLSQVFTQRSDIVSQITMIYKNDLNETAVVRARMNFDSTLIEWDVNIETIPVADG